MLKGKRFIGWILLLLLSSCMQDEELWKRQHIAVDDTDRGVFVINEGNFTYQKASLSYYDIDKEKVYNDVFFITNALPLGDVAQSMIIRDSLGYICVNNSGKIYVINTNTFEYVGKITGLGSPRYMYFINEQKAYVSDLYARSIYIINPKELEITGSISLNNPGSPVPRHNAEQFVNYGQYVFTNAWSFDDQVLVIDTESDQLVDSIRVGIQPNSMVMDRNNYLWVLCDGGRPGNPFGHEKPVLMQIDAQKREVVNSIFFKLEDSPTELVTNASRDTLYFINKHAFRLPVEGYSQPEIFVESPYAGNADEGFYGMAVDPVTSEIYISDGIDMVQNGYVYRYHPNGIAIDTFKVGIIPGGFCFRDN
ncbi:MAG: YncE family protein [Bacteroidota bacterium]|nr:YncE family protein [Bacteroidota bacterium]